MADDAPELINAEPPTTPERRAAGTEERQMLHELCTVAQQTFAPWRAHMMQQGASPNSDMLLATAMATFSGLVVGELVGMGILADSDVETVLDSFKINATTGVGIGKRHVAHCADKFLQDEAQQQGTGTKQ